VSLDFLEILGRRKKKIKYHKVGSGQIWPPHLWHNVTAIPSPRCVRSSRQRTGQTRRSPALSCRDERHETLTRKENKNKNATQYIHRLIYYHRLALVRQRQGRFPGQMPKHYLLNRQRISILPGTSRQSAETNRSPTASSYSYLDPAGWCLLGLGQTKLVAVLF